MLKWCRQQPSSKCNQTAALVGFYAIFSLLMCYCPYCTNFREKKNLKYNEGIFFLLLLL